MMNKFLLALVFTTLLVGAASAENGDSSLTDLLVGFVVVFAIGMGIRYALGKRSAPSVPSAPAGKGFCPECGTPAGTNSDFCSNCGARLK